MDLLEKIDEIGKMFKSLREENEQLKGTNQLLTEREIRTKEKLKSVIGDIDALLAIQGKTPNQ
ncbi:hypothetical protein LR066_04010 [candidate division WOR-3 bacterium]|nr:hypothetical protein [candidate division WOR-3 bacterium]